jgi:hypothetical protein
MAFADTQIGKSSSATLTIANQGNATLTVTGMTGPSVTKSSWTSGTIPAGGSQSATITFTPTAAQNYSGTITINGDQTSGTSTIAMTGRGVLPAGSFGTGSWRVGADIQAGRYFSAPTGTCYWEAVSGFGGTFGEILANDFISSGTFQAIVDILSTDTGFKTDSGCGIWRSSPTLGSQATIRPGTWLVGQQIVPDTYKATPTKSGCYWERRTDFRADISGIIANDFVSSTGQQFVTIASGDVGFVSDPDCGTWTSSSTSGVSSVKERTPDRAEIERAWRARRVHLGRP